MKMGVTRDFRADAAVASSGVSRRALDRRSQVSLDQGRRTRMSPRRRGLTRENTLLYYAVMVWFQRFK